jgi:hypothetical protein
MPTLPLLVNLLLLIGVQTAGAPAAQVPAALAPVQFLLGTGRRRFAREKRRFAFVPSGVQGRVIIRTNTAHYAATDQRPESRHDDLMIIYAEGAALKADYFDNEGHDPLRRPDAQRPRRRVRQRTECVRAAAGSPTLDAENAAGLLKVVPPGAAVFQPYCVDGAGPR